MPLIKAINGSELQTLRIETAASNNDYVAMVDIAANIPYKIKKADFLEGLDTNGGNGQSSNSWTTVSNNYSFNSNSKLILTGGNAFSITPQQSANDIEFYNVATTDISLYLPRYKGIDYTSGLKLKPGYTRLLRVNDTMGWYPLVNEILIPSVYPPGMLLYLDGGSLFDKSGNNRNASAVGSNSPNVVTGLDGKQVLRWNGTSNQELQVTPFLTSATSATLYVVFTVSSASNNYNLIKTANIDDYWRFAQESNGYIGTFLSARRSSYPSEMPSSGNHLVSIHSNSSAYEVLLNKVTKGSIAASFNAGDRFRIGTNDKNFSGDIALILVYPEYITPGGTKDNNVTSNIKIAYPSLPF
jgi:hypothetical protein